MSLTWYYQGDLQTKLKVPHVRRYPHLQWQYHPRVSGGVGAKHSRSVEPENAPTDGEVPFGSFWKIQFSGSMLLFRGVLALEMLLAIASKNTSPSARSLPQCYLGITILEYITAFQHIRLKFSFLR